ncbi:SRPBCC family protein [Actinoplanes sp. Pm04-4]|uniref:SRPBCC family protein n=1 Tax=Paractinoplanes pyxinae TaxID=2997416 RepID=A0ABT4AQM9_9ACTN|nr:SRPBCC family protein [Actinoplanes pyxinae]MCY1136551.1 SRPBCC family protein [Actinoplanes pyxinae]
MTHVEADPDLPIIRITREFRASPAKLLRAHTDPELFARWIGPDSLQTKIEHWDARTGGSFRYLSVRGDEVYAFYGSFHSIRPDRLVQTFTYEGDPDQVGLSTLWFDDLGDGRTRLRTQSLVDSFETRDGWLKSGMEVGLRDGYNKLERMLSNDAG